MLVVTKIPNVSAQSRAFVSGRSKRTCHDDLHTQTTGEGHGRKTHGQVKCVGRIQVVGGCLQSNKVQSWG